MADRELIVRLELRLPYGDSEEEAKRGGEVWLSDGPWSSSKRLREHMANYTLSARMIGADIVVAGETEPLEVLHMERGEWVDPNIGHLDLEEDGDEVSASGTNLADYLT